MDSGDLGLKLTTALKLGRVSNLPTVWTNTLVGLALVSVGSDLTLSVLACAIFSLFYLAGMYLNDAFDAEWDRQHQVDRPIPAGEVQTRTVIGFAVMFIALGLLVLIATSANPLLSTALGLLLFLCIGVYDWRHKQWPRAAPWIMGSCRFAVYLCAASLVFEFQWSWPLLMVAGSIWLYIAGITALARGEHSDIAGSLRPLVLLFAPCVCALVLGYQNVQGVLVTLFAFAWIVRAVVRMLRGIKGGIGQAVSALLAGIAALDAAFLFALNHHVAGVFSLLAFIGCLLLQRKISAT